jgi:hypothetical protein
LLPFSLKMISASVTKPWSPKSRARSGFLKRKGMLEAWRRQEMSWPCFLASSCSWVLVAVAEGGGKRREVVEGAVGLASL